MSDIPLEVLLQQAATLKTAQLAVDRVTFDSYPSWLKNSLFSTLDVIEGRQAASFQSKLNASLGYKSGGNAFISHGDYYSAINEYHKALAIWEWIESRLKDWKQHAIRDGDLSCKKYTPTTDKQVHSIKQIKISCLLNLSLCHLNLKQFALVIEACDSVLAIEPVSKAYYRRALARTIPLSTGTVERRMALEDLRQAHALSPQDSAIHKAYTELKADLIQQEAKDKATYGNLFHRSEAEAEAVRKSTEGEGCQSASLSVKEMELMIHDIEARIVQYQREGEHDADLEKLEHKKAVLTEALAICAASAASGASLSTPAPVKAHAADGKDYLHPTEEMIMGAKEHGLDLTDSRVQRVLAELHNQQQQLQSSNTHSPAVGQQHPVGPVSSSSSAHAQIDRTLLKLYESEADQLVQRILMDHNASERKEMLHYRLLGTDPSRLPISGTFSQAMGDEEIEQELQRLLHQEYMELYISYYSNKKEASGSSPCNSDTLDPIAEDEKEKDEWVTQVLTVLQRYYATPLSDDKQQEEVGTVAWHNRLKSVAVWVAGFIIFQLILYSYHATFGSKQQQA